MIKVLKLQKGVIAIVLGIIMLIAAQIMASKHVEGSDIVLAVSGFFLIVGALFFLYPILFAKKIDSDGKKVELKPIGEDDSHSNL